MPHPRFRDLGEGELIRSFEPRGILEIPLDSDASFVYQHIYTLDITQVREAYGELPKEQPI
jgi:hypothetical protein